MTTPDATLPKGRYWQFARTAARDTKDRERLITAVAGWTASEFYEYARSCHRRRHSDTPSAQAIRQALKCHARPEALLWLEHFRDNGSLPLPARSSEELDYPPGDFGIGPGQRHWPWHSADHIARIDGRAREQFGISDDAPVPPGRWGAAHHIYRQEVGLVPAPPPWKPRRRRTPKLVPPHFERNYPGHSAAFIAEVEARARNEFARRGLSTDRDITDGFWRWICQRDYEVTDISTTAAI